MPASCKHPQVRVVAREEDVEFVECQLCGEVFDSAEFADILSEEDPARRQFLLATAAVAERALVRSLEWLGIAVPEVM